MEAYIGGRPHFLSSVSDLGHFSGVNHISGTETVCTVFGQSSQEVSSKVRAVCGFHTVSVQGIGFKIGETPPKPNLFGLLQREHAPLKLGFASRGGKRWIRAG